MVARAEEPGDDLGAISQQIVQLINEARYGEAIPVAKHALVVAEQRYGQNHPEVGVALNNLAELYRLTGRYTEAEPLFKSGDPYTRLTMYPNAVAANGLETRAAPLGS